MCKKLIFVLALVAMVSPVLAIDQSDYSPVSPWPGDTYLLKCDIDAAGHTGPNDTQEGWTAWEMSGYYGPLGTQLKNFGNGIIVQMRGITWAKGAGNLGGSRDRVTPTKNNTNDLEGVLSDLTYIAHTAPGLGKDYIELSFRLGAKRAGWNIDITLFSWDPAFLGSGLAGYGGAGEQQDSKRVAWSETNPAQWLTDNGYDPNGYGCPAGPYVPGVTGSNMPAGLMALSEIALENGKATWISPFDVANPILYSATLNVTLDDQGKCMVYGWADLLTLTGSQHAALNGFVISLPEPTTIALLGLGGLALIRRKR